VATLDVINLGAGENAENRMFVENAGVCENSAIVRRAIARFAKRSAL
jgi:hypothetical protein